MEVHLKYARPDSWAGFTKYTNCADYLGPVWTRSGNRYTGLTEEDARRLEKALGYEEGHLGPHSKFWVTYAIKIEANGIIMHTEYPEDELKYLFCKKHKRVAPSKSKIRPSHDFYLIDNESDAIESTKYNKLRLEAFNHLKQMSFEEISKALRLYGYSSFATTVEVAESKLFELIDENPQRFLNIWVNNKSRETQFLIEEAVSKNIIRCKKNLYYYGTDVIGNSLDDTIANLDNKDNQELKLAILEEIESKSGKVNPKKAA